jgi:hypothetical protein
MKIVVYPKAPVAGLAPGQLHAVTAVEPLRSQVCHRERSTTPAPVEWGGRGLALRHSLGLPP